MSGVATHAKMISKQVNACQNFFFVTAKYEVLQHMPKLVFVSERMPKNVEIKIWSGNACQIMNFDSISQVNPYSNSQSINVAFSPGVISLYAASVGSHTFGRPGGGQKCGPRRRPPMCIHFPQVLRTDIRKHENMSFDRLSQLLSYIPNTCGK